MSKTEKFTIPYEEMKLLRESSTHLSVKGNGLLVARHPIPPEQKVLFQALRNQFDLKSPSYSKILFASIYSSFLEIGETLSLVILKTVFFLYYRSIKKNSFAVLFKSWAFDIPTVDTQDFYFGALPNEVHKHKISTGVLLDTGKSIPFWKLGKRLAAEFTLINSIKKSKDYRRLPEYLWTSWYAPLLIFIDQLCGALELKRLSNTSNNVRRILVSAASIECLRAATRQQILIAHRVCKAVNTLKTEKVVLLWEGQPWELLTTHLLRKLSPAVAIIGYQHAPIFPHSLEILEPMRNTTPNVLFTSSEHYEAQLKNNYLQTMSNAMTLGTIKYAERDVPSQIKLPIKTILLAPSTADEATRLLALASAFALKSPDFKFILRLHPAVRYKFSPTNSIALSFGKTLEHDLSVSSFLIYEGSSVVYDAILRGLKPFHLKYQDLYESDPLYELHEWKNCVTDADSLALLIKRFLATDTRTYTMEWQRAVNFIQSMRSSVTLDRLNNFIQELQ